jgi:lysophospholipase L1-like esterase
MREIVRQWQQRSQESIRVIAFGSSNTAIGLNNAAWHWVTWLEIGLKLHLGNHLCVINRGIGGETADDLLRRLERDVLSFAPAMVIITVGGNDCFQGHSLGQFRATLIEICARVRRCGTLPVLQTYYCPMYALGQPGFAPLFESFMQIDRELAQELGVPLIDQYALFEPLYRAEPEGYARLMLDWIHPDRLGCAIMGQQVLTVMGLAKLPLPEAVAREAESLPGLIRQHL